MATAYLLCGLGFGDESKGSITDFLCHHTGAKLVVRYNGGAQAAHNVVLPDGRHHTFSQFGAGTLAGAETFLSRFVLVDPPALMAEGKHLQDIGVADPYKLVSVDRDALVVTPYHRAANRLRELTRERRGGRHGSCGVGIGETMADWLDSPDMAITIGDLQDRKKMMVKLRWLRSYKMNQLGLLMRDAMGDASIYAEQIKAIPEDVADMYGPFLDKVNIVGREYLKKYKDRDLVFEGAQGVLLDQDVGFAPHCTWTNIRFNNADHLLHEIEYSGEQRRIGILRTYTTRHGAGPFPSENPHYQDFLQDDHNISGPWQHHLRAGPLDLVLTRYALECLSGVDGIALTHCDKPVQTLCYAYEPHPAYLDVLTSGRIQPVWEWERSPRLTTALAHAKPLVTKVPDGQLHDYISIALGTPIWIKSFGACRTHKVVEPHARKYLHERLHSVPVDVLGEVRLGSAI